MKDEIKDEIKEIRDYIACPQLGDNYYGKWGALRLDQRLKIKSLLDCITNLQEENKRLSLELSGYRQAILNDDKLLGLQDYKSRIENAKQFIKEKISSTKGVINDYMYHKEHNKILIELLQEDIEYYKKELNILQGEDKE